VAIIERVELGLVNLTPKVKRTDAIQSFVSQETPMLRVFDRDGAIGTGYSYTIGTAGSSIMALLSDHLAPRLIGRDADAIEAIWRDLLFSTHATSVGAITSLALAAVDTALWGISACRRAKLAIHAGGGNTSLPLYSRRSVARGIWRRSTSRGSRSRCQPATSARIASWRDRPGCRLRSANRSTASRNSRIISRQMPARSCGSMWRASEASCRGSKLRTWPKRSTFRSAPIS
jgi:hypothetical protein